MQLLDIRRNELSEGQPVLVLGGVVTDASLELHFVSRVDPDTVYLVHPGVLLAHDACACIPMKDAESRLRYPHFERGDRVRYQGREGFVTRANPDDLHVFLQLDEHPEREIYTNVVHVDFSPALRQALARQHG